VSEADFLSTGYYGLQTGILGITAIFTLVFAYLGGLHLFLRKENLLTRLATYLVFVGAFLFLHLFLYSASLFGQEWIDSRVVTNPDEASGFYENYSVAIMRFLWGVVAFATLVFITIETFRKQP